MRRETGDYPGAARTADEALGIFRNLGDRHGQANALSYLGDVRRLTRSYVTQRMRMPTVTWANDR